MKGIVKAFKSDRGFGFISPSDGGAAVFVHITAVPRGEELREGDRVTYSEEFDARSRKTRAIDVRLCP